MTADNKTWISTAAPVTPRLELRHDPAVQRFLDGAWWPRSHSTVTELTNLITALDSRHLPITRIMLNAAAWDEHPRRIGVAGRTVRLGWFATLEACLLIATTGTNSRIDLLVVPPELSAAPAAAAMAKATSDDAHDNLRAEAIMAAVSTRAPAQRLAPPRPKKVRAPGDGRVNGHQAAKPT